MSAELPGALRAGMDRMLEGVSRKDLARRAAAISEHYRTGGASAAVIANRLDVLAYLTTRLPATYAAVAAALGEMRLRRKDFAPATVLDIGAGPGTASWAALSSWPTIEAVTMVDASRPFLATARDLAAGSGSRSLEESATIAGDAAAILAGDALSAELVLLGFSLAELAESQRREMVAAAWRSCRGMLVIVEPGTPDGFARIREARALLTGFGATIVAPCPHDAACPMVAPDWCHFSVRLPRSRDHMITKNAVVPFEDEKFSYVAAAREADAHAAPIARVLAPPRTSKAGIGLKLCTPAGIVERDFPRRDRAAFGRIRRARWGDAITDES